MKKVLFLTCGLVFASSLFANEATEFSNQLFENSRILAESSKNVLEQCKTNYELHAKIRAYKDKLDEKARTEFEKDFRHAMRQNMAKLERDEDLMSPNVCGKLLRDKVRKEPREPRGPKGEFRGEPRGPKELRGEPREPRGEFRGEPREPRGEWRRDVRGGFEGPVDERYKRGGFREDAWGERGERRVAPREFDGRDEFGEERDVREKIRGEYREIRDERGVREERGREGGFKVPRFAPPAPAEAPEKPVAPEAEGEVEVKIPVSAPAAAPTPNSPAQEIYNAK